MDGVAGISSKAEPDSKYMLDYSMSWQANYEMGAESRGPCRRFTLLLRTRGLIPKILPGPAESQFPSVPLDFTAQQRPHGPDLY